MPDIEGAAFDLLNDMLTGQIIGKEIESMGEVIAAMDHLKNAAVGQAEAVQKFKEGRDLIGAFIVNEAGPVSPESRAFLAMSDSLGAFLNVAADLMERDYSILFSFWVTYSDDDDAAALRRAHGG